MGQPIAPQKGKAMNSESTVTISTQEYADLVQHRAMLLLIMQQAETASYELSGIVKLVAKCLNQSESGAADA